MNAFRPVPNFRNEVSYRFHPDYLNTLIFWTCNTYFFAIWVHSPDYLNIHNCGLITRVVKQPTDSKWNGVMMGQPIRSEMASWWEKEFHMYLRFRGDATSNHIVIIYGLTRWAMNGKFRRHDGRTFSKWHYLHGSGGVPRQTQSDQWRCRNIGILFLGKMVKKGNPLFDYHA